MSEYDDLFEDDPPVVATATVDLEPMRQPVLPSKHQFLYLDLETCPDYDRLDLFDIPSLPPVATELLPAEEFCSQTLKEIQQWFEQHSAPESWLMEIEFHERQAKKPRSGLFEALDKTRNLAASQRKLLSVTPEYCRIVAAAWTLGNGQIHSSVFDRNAEATYLETLWREFSNTRTIVGYNILGFDLPVILTRSAILGVTPSRRINLSPYRNTEVCDLMNARWPKGAGQPMKLKSLARALGIEIPADDCDGSQVEFLYNTDPEKLKAYVSSDVEVTRKIHQFWSGYFVD